MPSALPWLVDSASRMTNLSTFMAAQPSSAHPSTDSIDEFASINGESFGTPDTKSERSRYYDADSDAGMSTSASQMDPADEAPSLLPNGASSPISRASSVRSSGQQRHLPEASPASLLGRIHELQEQREAMNGQLFSLKRSNEALQQDNTALTAQNTTMQRQTGQLQQECRQLRDEVAVARCVSNAMGRAAGRAAALHESNTALAKSRAEVDSYRKELAAVRQKRQEEQMRKHDQMLEDNSWSGILKYCGTTMLLVAIGAGSILVLDNMLQDDESKRLLVKRK